MGGARTKRRTLLSRADVLVAGAVRGEVLATDEPLSFWGGYDPQTGEIIDRRHALSGANAAGRILVLPFTRGSSTTTAILLEAVRQATAPAALITTRPDPFLCLASVVAEEMYGVVLPVVVVAEEVRRLFRTGERIEIDERGRCYRLAID